ncbi:unnamed protein product, partial [Didymodactylos carnosus]
YPILRLLLPQSDRERIAYGLKESKLAKHLIDVLSIAKTSADAQKLTNFRAQKNSRTTKGNDFADVVYYVLKNRSNEDRTLTIYEINSRLDDIALENGRGKDGQKAKLKWLIRILLKDLKISLKENSILECFHPDAKDLFDHTSNLLKVAVYLHDPLKRLHEIGLSIFSPFRPMLGERTKADKVEETLRKKSSHPQQAVAEFYIETKWDGYFSRNGHDYTDIFGSDSMNNGTLTPFIANTFHLGCLRCILDGEMVIYNRNEKIIHSKGDSFDVKSIQANDSQLQPCLIVFDILLYNDEILTNKPLHERLSYVKSKVFEPIEGRIMLSEIRTAHNNQDVINELNMAIDQRQEGIVVKDPFAVYKPNTRENGGWLKIKPDYMLGLNDEIDCLIVGGYFGTGRRSGLLSHFLCCALVKQNDTNFNNEQKDEQSANPMTSSQTQAKPEAKDYLYYSFCKIGSGYTHKELLDFNNRLSNKWKTYNRRAPPAHLLCTYEKPDLYINPEDSCIVQIRAVEFVASDKYKTGFTLRFPRLEKFREDKSWYECVSYQDLIDLKEKNAGKLAMRQFMNKDPNNELDGDMDIEENLDKTKTLTKKTVTKSRQQQKATVDQRFRGIDPQAVKKTQDFLDMKEFCIFEGDSDHSKAKLETLVLESGGKVVQNPLPTTYCVVTNNPNALRLKTLIKHKERDIVYVKWLLRCIKEKQLLRYNLSDIISCNSQTQAELDKLYDKYGDSYYDTTNEEDLRSIFEKITGIQKPPQPSTTTDPPPPPPIQQQKKQTKQCKRLIVPKHPPIRKRAKPIEYDDDDDEENEQELSAKSPSPVKKKRTNETTFIVTPPPPPQPVETDEEKKLRLFIAEFENEYFPDDSLFGLFRLCNIYFDEYLIINDSTTRTEDNVYELAKLEVKLHGGQVYNQLTPTITHVICSKAHTKQMRLDEFKHLNHKRPIKFRLVDIEWIISSIEDKRLLNELPFAV